jgi:hypothetical protein
VRSGAYVQPEPSSGLSPGAEGCSRVIPFRDGWSKALAFIDFLYGAPVWQMGIVVSILVVGGTVAVLFVVDRLWSKELRRTHNDIAGFLIAVVGIIFAILVSSLAITVMNRQDRAEALVVQEAEIVSALERESHALLPSYRQALQADIKTYLDAVVDQEWNEMSLAHWPTAGNAAVMSLWSTVTGMPVDNLQQMLTVQDLRGHLDKLTELRRERGQLATTGVDRVVWAVVLLGAAATIIFAILFGVPHFGAHILMTGLLSFTIALAMIMIVAIDWPFFGGDTISPAPIAELRALMAG